MDDDKKITKKIDKLIMGVILGGAIGSVIGLTLAPRKGKETRAFIKKKGKELIEKGKDASEQFMRDHHEQIEGAKFKLGKMVKNLFRWLLRRKPKNAHTRSSIELPDEFEKE